VWRGRGARSRLRRTLIHRTKGAPRLFLVFYPSLCCNEFRLIAITLPRTARGGGIVLQDGAALNYSCPVPAPTMKTETSWHGISNQATTAASAVNPYQPSTSARKGSARAACNCAVTCVSPSRNRGQSEDWLGNNSIGKYVQNRVLHDNV